MIASGYVRNVFINCPFDSTYRPLFEAIAFATYSCGFNARSALEVDDSSGVRIEKITGIIRESRLSVHDISRTQLDRGTRLPRFNMPLELGIFLGAKSFGSGDHLQKVAIILDTDRYRYQKFISDIAGQDIRAHGGSTDEAIRQVRDFLSTHREPGVFLPGGDKLVDRYGRFRRALPGMCRELHLAPSRLTFRDLSGLIVTWLRKHPLESAAPRS
ncbi:MAG: hypothetical protein ICV87_05535 [Gemmatimonadetes bacterium]|nr:hypothetical protein [Gemmatimonadota bacterium]